MLDRDPRMYYMDWIWDRLVWVKPIRLHSHARVFSALSQSGSRYWHSQSLWLSIDRPARHYRVTPWARSKACWELEGMAFTLNIHIGHSTVWNLAFIHFEVLDVHQWCLFRNECNDNCVTFRKFHFSNDFPPMQGINLSNTFTHMPNRAGCFTSSCIRGFEVSHA